MDDTDFVLTPPDPKDDGIQSGLSRYEVDQLLWSNQELDRQNVALEQKLKRLTSRLEEIVENESRSQPDGAFPNDRYKLAEELLKEVKE